MLFEVCTCHAEDHGEHVKSALCSAASSEFSSSQVIGELNEPEFPVGLFLFLVRSFQAVENTVIQVLTDSRRSNFAGNFGFDVIFNFKVTAETAPRR